MRFHVHVSVDSLEKSIPFYTALFGSDPTVQKPDYAKWQLDDPRMNFAISEKGCADAGVNHLGIQAETSEELDELYRRLNAADIASQPEKGARCCYAEGNKHWTADPSGVVWETFHTMNEIAVYGEDTGQAVAAVLEERGNV